MPVAGLPVNNQVGHFVRYGVAHEIIKIFYQKLLIEAQEGFAAVISPGLPGTPPAQRKIDQGIRKIKSVICTGSLLSLTYGGLDLFQEFPVLCVVGHVN